MKCEEFMLKLLTLCVAWTLSLAQHGGQVGFAYDQTAPGPEAAVPPSSDDDFDPQDFEEAQVFHLI